MTIKCIAIEDEPPALKQIRDYIEKVPFLSLEQTFYNAIEPISYLKDHEVDLIFLDIEMEDFTGIQFIKTLKNPPLVILTTAYDSYAIEAFDLEVTDYLLKPISFDRFLQAVEKVYTMMAGNRSNGEPTGPGYAKDYIFLKTEYKIQRVNLKDILYIEGQREYLQVHTTTEKIMTLQSFKHMAALLPEYFVRVHNSYMVSLDKIDSIERQRIRIGEVLIPISTTYRNMFYELLKQRNML